MRNMARPIAAVVAVGAVALTIAGLAGPSLLTLLQHPDDPGGDGVPAAPAVAGRAYPGDPAKEPALAAADAQRVVDAQAAASAAAGRKVDVSRAFRVLTTPRATLVLPGRGTPYTLDELAATAPGSVRASGGTYDVVEDLLVARGATLQLDAGQTVRLASDASGFSSIVASGGAIVAAGTSGSRVAIESWDAGANAPDTRTADGRAYIRVTGGALQLTSTDVTGLGFWSGSTSGLTASGGSGSSGAAGDIGVGADGATSIAIASYPAASASVALDDVTIRGGATGLAVDGIAGAKLTGTTVADSLVDGVALQDVSGASIASGTVSGNARDGIAVSGASSHLAIGGTTVTGNARDGITVDGRAAASDPDGTGAGSSPATGAAITTSTVTGNGRYGVELLGGRDPSVAHSTIAGGVMGVVAHGGVASPRVTDDAISGQLQRGVAILDGTTKADVEGDRISRTAVGIQVRDAGATVTGNRIADAAVEGISLVGSLSGSRIISNTIVGTGAGSVDAARAQHATIEDNLVDGWVQSQSLSQVVAGVFSPLTAIWSAVLALVALSVLWRLGSADRRRQRAPLQQFSRGVLSREAAGGTR
jgi:parallel beta-helix repeat protein